jgi:hypothetical protein
VRLALAAVLLTLACTQACAENDGLFVAVGYGGRRITSRDGVNWENDQRWSNGDIDNDDVLFDVAFGAGHFIAVGGGERTGHILSTSDGHEWQPVQQVNGRVATIAYGDGHFVAAHDAELMSSRNGTKFESGPRLAWKGSIHPRRSAFGETEAGNCFVILGDIDLWAERKRVHWRGLTVDGTHWDHTALDTPAAMDIAFGAGHFVVVGPAGLIESSHDGQVWERHATDPAENFSRVIWTGTRFLVSGGSALWISPDALTWTRQIPAPPCDIAWARQGFLGLGFSWGGNVFISRDFTTWKKVAVPPGPSLNAVAFGQP